MITFSRSGVTGNIGAKRIDCRWTPADGGMIPGSEYTLLPAKDPVWGVVVFVFPAALKGRLIAGEPGTSAAKPKKIPNTAKMIPPIFSLAKPAGAVCIISGKPVPGLKTLQAFFGLSNLVKALPREGVRARFL